MKKRRLTALFMAAFMGLSAPAGVQAAVSYQDAEKAALADALKPFVSSYSEQLSVYGDAMKGSRADISLELHDTGKALLGIISPADISWLDKLEITGGVGVNDTQLAEVLDVNLNGTKICTMEVYMDTASMNTYVRIPELADGYIKAPFEEAMAEAYSTEEDSAIDTEAFLKDYMKALPNLPDYLPSPENLNTVIDRYASILIDHAQETSSGTETLSVSSVSQECTVLDAELTGNNAIAAVEEILKSVQTDEELKSIISNLEKMSPESGISYDAVMKEVDSLLADIPQDSDGTYDDSYNEALMTSKIWLDDKDSIIGRQLIIKDGEEDNLNLTWKAPASDNTCGFSFFMEADDEAFELSGTGTLNGSLLDGSYELTYNDQPAAVIAVSGYNTESMEKGSLNGTYTISVHPDADEEISQSLGSFGISISFTGDSTNGGATLSVSSASVPIISLSIMSSLEDGSVEFLDLNSIEKVYDVSSDTDMADFESSMTLDIIMANLTAAGMPENFIEDLTSSGMEESYEDAYGSEPALEYEDAPVYEDAPGSEAEPEPEPAPETDLQPVA